MGGAKIAHCQTGGCPLRFSAMTKQRPITARDHRAGVLEQGLDGMACRRLLPVVAIERSDAEHDLRDFLLRRAGAIAVDALEHSSLSCALLLRQPRVGWNGPAVKGRE